jgi:outer membrane protein assembly factor BamC
MGLQRLGSGPIIVLAAVVAAGPLAGCQGTLEDGIGSLLPEREPAYRSSRGIPSLEVPPDLTSSTVQDALPVPAVGGTTYSQFASAGARPVSAAPGVLAQPEGVRVVRAGDKRWLEVDANPGEVWPRVRDFWQAQGFLIETEDPAIGIMETDWAEQRTPMASGPISGLLRRLQSRVYGVAVRDRFRTRLERGSRPGVTEVYISHRGAEEIYTGQEKDLQADVDGRAVESRVWQPRPADPELEAEMLHRLMTSFGVPSERAGQIIAAADRGQPERARMLRDSGGGSVLALDEDFSRAWRRTGLALDRVGFTVEDRDRSRGLFFVRYADPDRSPEPRSGFLSRLRFWDGEGKAPPEEYLVSLIGDGDRPVTQVLVLSVEGERAQTPAAERILSLLHEQLR